MHEGSEHPALQSSGAAGCRLRAPGLHPLWVHAGAAQSLDKEMLWGGERHWVGTAEEQGERWARLGAVCGTGQLLDGLRRPWVQRSTLSRARKPGSVGQISCVVQSAVAQHMESGQDLQKSSLPSVSENLIIYPSI